MIHFLWLFPLIFLALWQYPQIDNWPKAWLDLVFYSPYVIAGLGIFISLWLNRIQPILILLTLILLNIAVGYFFGSQHLGLTAQILYPVFTILLPLNLLVWLLLPERGLYGKTYVGSLLGLFLVQVLFVFWYVETMPSDLINFLSQPVLLNNHAINLPMISVVVSILVWVVLVVKNSLSYQRKVLDTAVIFILFLMMVGLDGFETFGVLAWVSVISALMVVLAVIFDTHHIAYTDELTGLKGRRALFESFAGLGRKYTIAMMDIDHFKKFNDSYGHDVGDEVLRIVAQQLSLIQKGVAFRYGGEEFTILFKGKSSQEVKPYVEEVREAIANQTLKFKHQNKSTKTKVTVSFGIAEKTAEYTNPEDVLKAADQALYQAKSVGRNCVIISGDKVVSPKSKRTK